MGFAKGLNNVTVLIKCMSYETTRQRDRQDVTSRNHITYGKPIGTERRKAHNAYVRAGRKDTEQRQHEYRV